jgi:hypothetical protein
MGFATEEASDSVCRHCIYASTKHQQIDLPEKHLKVNKPAVTPADCTQLKVFEILCTCKVQSPARKLKSVRRPGDAESVDAPMAVSPGE